MTYHGAGAPSLEDIDFNVKAGSTVGIIGGTGSGKTTVADLILRTYNVPDGTVFIDGRDVNTIPIKSVRRYSAYVPQDNFLFSDTIANNIAFAVDEKNMEGCRCRLRLPVSCPLCQCMRYRLLWLQHLLCR